MAFGTVFGELGEVSFGMVGLVIVRCFLVREL